MILQNYFQKSRKSFNQVNHGSDIYIFAEKVFGAKRFGGA